MDLASWIGLLQDTYLLPIYSTQESRRRARFQTFGAKACHPERSEGSGSPNAEILRCAQDDNQDTAHGKPSLQMSRRAVCYLTMRYVRWVTPLPALTYGLSSSTGVVLRCSNKRTPSPSRTGTRSMWI